MAGRPLARAKALAEREEELEALGLLGVYIDCPAPVRRGCNICLVNGMGSCGKDPEDCGTEPCGRPVMKGRLRCVGHRSQDITLNQTVTSNEILAEMREYMSRELLPLAVGAVRDVLEDEEASHEVKLRASAMTMDRTGAPAGATLTVEQTVRVLPPEEMIRTAAEDVRQRLIAAGVLAPPALEAAETVRGSVLTAEQVDAAQVPGDAS